MDLVILSKEEIVAQAEPGWRELVGKLVDDLVNLEWDRDLLQIKEKYAGLRFYAANCSDEMWDLIDKAELESVKICQICGSPGKIRGDYWLVTLCDECDKNDYS